MANVLIVDDSKTSRKILREILEKNGHPVVGEAVNGEEGLKPDIVTLDITMPVMDGLEALKEIKSYDVNAVVIMITAAGQKSKMVEAIKEGCAEFLTKPFDDEQIINIINHFS